MRWGCQGKAAGETCKGREWQHELREAELKVSHGSALLGTQERTGISWKDFRNMLRNEKKMGGKEKSSACRRGEASCEQRGQFFPTAREENILVRNTISAWGTAAYYRGTRSFSDWSCTFFPLYWNNLNLFLYVSPSLFISVLLVLADNISDGVCT